MSYKFVFIFIALILVTSCKSRSDEKLSILIQGLSSTNKSVKNSSALEIAGYGKDGKKAVPALVKLLNTESNRGIRTSAAYALRSIGTPEAVEALDKYKE